MLINSQQMSCDSHKAALASDWLAFFSSMARTKKMPRMGEGRKALQVRTRAEVHSEQEPPVLADPHCQKWKPLQPRVSLRRGERRQRSWGRWGVTGVIANPTVGPDGCRGSALYIRWGEAIPKETQTNYRR